MMAALGEFRFPMPEFSTGHTHPAMQVPEPSNAMAGWDVLVLVLVLTLGAFLVLKRRRRREIVGLTIFCLLYFGFWRNGCVCSVGSVQNVVGGLADQTMGVPVTVLLFFAAPLLFALFFGRVFCAAVCPLGAMQEMVALKPVKVPLPVETVLRLIPHLYLGLTVLSVVMGAGFLICRYDPFVGFFRLGAGLGMLVFGGIVLVIGIFVARPYCRYLCPYGVLLGWMSRLSKFHATISPGRCIQCKLCSDACPYNAILAPTPKELPEKREKGAWRLGMMLVLIPVLGVLGAGVGGLLREPLSRLHPTVRLAERMAGEERGRYAGYTIESEAFRASDRPTKDLYAEAAELKGRFATGGRWLGGYLGLLIGCQLAGSAILRRRTGYETDRQACVSCGRCFKFCPVEKKRDD
jgi:NosR/NirI family transcriptional regulator, nitrous oxide reductase regulator